MHGIEKPIDIVLSTIGSEWHGLADTVPAIDDESIAPLLFKIRTGTVSVDIDGAQVPMSHHKALVADMRHRAELLGTVNELVPLHIPKNGYAPIENGRVWEALQAALTGTGVKVTSAGTLHAGKKFFLSADLQGASEVVINGDKFCSFLNFVTSHDGTMALTVVDSHVRQVCQNTVTASLASAGDLGFKIYHTAGADTAVSNLGELLNAVLQERADFKTNLEYFASVGITVADVERLFAGYFATVNGADALAKRSLNSVEALTVLFSRGIATQGKSLYDVFNAATQFWTHEDGTGKKASKIEKAYKARFGTASDHKRILSNYLLSPDRVSQLIEAGRKVLTIAVK
jgi:hypothetical protein